MVSTVKKGNIRDAACTSREVLAIIADKWTVLIIHILADRPHRHNEIARALGNISQKVLTQALRKLERNGIITRHVYPVVPPKVEYALSPIGKSLVKSLTALADWAERHFRDVEGARRLFDAANK